MSIADRAGTQQITFLDTRDLARTGDFYERILGLRLARDQGTCRIDHACVRDPNGYLVEIQQFWEPLV